MAALGRTVCPNPIKENGAQPGWPNRISEGTRAVLSGKAVSQHALSGCQGSGSLKNSRPGRRLRACQGLDRDNAVERLTQTADTLRAALKCVDHEYQVRVQ